ncbi:MAG: DUF4159 domain-containing protein [Kiritimatiellae bacterium]|nr:DUF4159 domain-containing protein [Kiritimatiellia bacterium]
MAKLLKTCPPVFRLCAYQRFASAIICFCLCAAARAQTGAELYGRDIYWNATPNDINNLLRSMKDQVDAHFHMDVRTLDEISVDPEQNPVLYRTGHYRFEFTRAERQRLRRYLLAGGMMIFNTGLGSLPFYQSAVKELGEIFPEQPLQRLTADHPVFHSYYDVDRVQYAPAVSAAGYQGFAPWFDAVEINCRVVALVSRWGMAVGWEGNVQKDYQAYLPESAFKLGVNILTYASSMRAWAKNAAQSMKFINKDEPLSDTVAVAQVQYDGVWKTRHAGLSVLLQTFNRRTGIPVRFGLREMRLTDPDIFSAPLLYITGHEHFELKPAEITALRKYLQNGGFLFGEACCGRRGFDLAFRKMMKSVLPRHFLQPIPGEAGILKEPNNAQQAGVTPALMQETGAASIMPRLEGIELDGYYAVIYSPFALAGGWEMSQSPYARGYNDESAIRIGQNILMYSVTH